MKTVKTLLENIRYDGHVSIRRKLFSEIHHIGGGFSSEVIARYGGYKIDCVRIVDNVLIIYVK